MKKGLVLSLLFNLVCIPFLIFYSYKKVEAYNSNQKTVTVPNPVGTKLPDIYYKTNLYWQRKKSLYDVLPVTHPLNLFIGDSLTDWGNWDEMFPDYNIINRGIGGDDTEGLLSRIHQITKLHPQNVFILIGTNDLNFKFPISKTIKEYNSIIDSLQSSSTKIYILSVLPKSSKWVEFSSVSPLNDSIKTMTKKRGLTYINLYKEFVTEEGTMNPSLSNDGIHINGQGYLIWAKIIKPYLK